LYAIRWDWKAKEWIEQEGGVNRFIDVSVCNDSWIIVDDCEAGACQVCSDWVSGIFAEPSIENVSLPAAKF